jgi:Na+/melibiose symporter-like transporter
MWTWTLVLIVIAAGFAPILDNNFGPGASSGMIGKIVVYGAIVIVLTFGILFWHMRAIRPLLHGARPTTEQISVGDRLRTQARAAATWYLAMIELAMLLFCVTAAISMFAADTWLGFVGWLFVLCFFAVLAIYYARLLMLKRRQRVAG